MTKKKVKLAFITNDSTRKTTFNKKKKGLMKNVSELNTLCGIDTCAIIYSPYESQPEVWPDTQGVHCVLVQFKWMPVMEQSKKNQESLIRQRIAKASEQWEFAIMIRFNQRFEILGVWCQIKIIIWEIGVLEPNKGRGFGGK
ncbi:Agamous-like MADS-box protein AGL80 [Abeliophyllum distichum]|uniref:Agamous-like MADS-box protein AGL80 n=1 Tax=Abeliophyllum distichum TaxID=126358 RepID=A0ABD1SAY1_9LAMI